MCSTQTNMEHTTESNESTEVVSNPITIDGVTLSKYSDKSFKASGEATRAIKGHLKTFGGRWNSRLRDGPGWIFPMTKYSQVKQFLENVPSSAVPLSQSYYQRITYKLIRPVVGMKVTITYPDKQVTGVVTDAYPRRDNTVTTSKVTLDPDPSVPKDEFADFVERPTETLIISDGNWKVKGKPLNHTVDFVME